MAETVKVTRDIAAAPDIVWEMIADLPRMGEWSPENTGGKWIKGSSGPALGAQFTGSNKNGRHSWSTLVTVVACNKAKAFDFEVAKLGFKVARWSYAIEPTDQGCRVSETFTDLRIPMIKVVGRPVSGVSDRETHNRATMETTLANLAAAAES